MILDLSYLSYPLPPDIQRLYEAGDFARMDRVIRLRLDDPRVLPQTIGLICPNLIHRFANKPTIGRIVHLTISQFYDFGSISRKSKVSFPSKIFRLNISR